MKVLVFAYILNTYATNKLAESFRAKGDEVWLVSPLECSLEVNRQGHRTLHHGVPFPEIDALFLRGLTYIDYGVPVPRTLETSMAMPFVNGGTLCFNAPEAKLIAADKLASLQKLADGGLPVPATFFVWSSEELDRIINAVGTPIILKTLDGTWGIGVIRCDSPASARSTFQTLRSTGRPIMAQQYVRESRGEDLRVVVLGDRVLAAMRRKPAPGEFRSNIGRGASAESVTLSAEQERLAITAARTIGLEIAGIDLIESDSGPLILEANPVPGLKKLDQVCGIDSPKEIVDYVRSRHVRQAR